MNTTNENELRPQPGPQTAFLQCTADIAGLGGGAGSGKSHATLMEHLHDISNPKFRSVIFRRTVPRIRQPGGLLDASESIYPLLGAALNANELEWTFPSGATIKFAGMELEADRFSWQGSQLALITFEEAQEMAPSQIWFMLSRLRSVSGVRPRLRFTCNPDADSWLRPFLDWWIGPDGFPITERAGKWRFFVRSGEHIAWADTREELLARFGEMFQPKSVTFFPATLRDNKILMEKDPSYIGSLAALPLIDRARLLDGNWNIRSCAGNFFRREWLSLVDSAPMEVAGRVRYWDRAATLKVEGRNDPDASVGLLLSKTRQGIYHIEDVKKAFASPHKIEEMILRCAHHDPPGTIVSFAQDPGSAGKGEAQATARALDRFDVRFATVTGSKEVRAKPISAQCEAGNVKVVRALWNEELFQILESFPECRHDDEVDALSGAHGVLSEPSGAITSLSDIFVPRPFLDGIGEIEQIGPDFF